MIVEAIHPPGSCPAFILYPVDFAGANPIRGPHRPCRPDSLAPASGAVGENRQIGDFPAVPSWFPSGTEKAT